MLNEIGTLRSETQHEIGALRNEIRQLRTEMHEMEARLRIEIRSEGTKLRAELHKEIAALRGEVGNLAWKVAGLLVVQTVVIVAVVKLLPDFEPRRRRLRGNAGEA